MKTFYWSFLLMLLPSMAYTQNTEKENEFTMSMQIRPRAEYRNGALTPRDEGVDVFVFQAKVDLADFSF